MNESIGNILAEIKKEYPEIKEEEIIKILNNTENQEDGEKILKNHTEPQEILRILEARDRREAGPTAPAKGLTLIGMEYEKTP